MAPWGDAKLLFSCILLIACCCTVTVAEIPIDCCLTVRNATVPKHRVADYRKQNAGEGCSISAMILLTRRGVKLCVPVDAPWLTEVVNHVHTVREHCKKQNFKGKRCFGVKP